MKIIKQFSFKEFRCILVISTYPNIQPHPGRHDHSGRPKSGVAAGRIRKISLPPDVLLAHSVSAPALNAAASPAGVLASPSSFGCCQVCASHGRPCQHVPKRPSSRFNGRASVSLAAEASSPRSPLGKGAVRVDRPEPGRRTRRPSCLAQPPRKIPLFLRLLLLLRATARARATLRLPTAAAAAAARVHPSAPREPHAARRGRKGTARSGCPCLLPSSRVSASALPCASWPQAAALAPPGSACFSLSRERRRAKQTTSSRSRRRERKKASSPSFLFLWLKHG